jgi:hypothetical protein
MSALVFVTQHFLRNKGKNVLKVTRLSDGVIVTTVRERAPGLRLGLANGE